MVDGTTLEAPLARTSVAANEAALAPATLQLSVTTTHRIDEVEAIWRGLEAAGIESPGQSFDFVRLWVHAREIPERNQLYVVASLAGRPVALLPLHWQSRWGIRAYSWFTGSHVGCCAPLLDLHRFTALRPEERRTFWRGVLRSLPGADLVFLRAVPAEAHGVAGLFAELGEALPVETLFRSVFSSWEEANTIQRSKSRRKHDRQQSDRLEALGKIEFEAVTPGDAALPVLEEMFRQRARRFEVMGVKNPFAPADIARFYHGTVAPGSRVKVLLHVLRLNGEIVAVRYNIAHGDRLFCLISSMSDDEAVQTGSPGKQCLLRVMQSVFDEGYRVFDIGNGSTDEKRRWCNVQIGVGSHYAPLTVRGRVIVALHRQWLALRARIKGNEKLLSLVKGLRAKLYPASHRSPEASAAE